MAKYDIDIEGTIHPWNEDTITVPQLCELGGFPPGQEMIEVDLEDNTEVVLAPEAIVKVKPGKGFAKKVAFKRG
jgi:hypothetical protein